MDEMERPQMPADLNARLMKRVGEKSAKPQRRRMLWPWIAAACVAGVIAVYLTPPKASSPTPLQVEGGVVAQKDSQPKVEQSAAEPAQTIVEQPAVQPVQVPVKRIVAKVEPKKVETPSVVPQEKPATTEQLLAQETKPVEQKVEQKSVTLTERDIPITRPENYKYTPEEIALMKKQANEAYMKWVELELEIAKNNLEQTAQK
jgi:hypothetical protein